MENRNCPNCGAPYDIHLNTCPYCNTSYFDMSAIDIGSTEPFYLKLRMGNSVFTSKVVASSSEVIFDSNSCHADFTGDDGAPIKTVRIMPNIDININFRSINSFKGNDCLYEVVSYES